MTTTSAPTSVVQFSEAYYNRVLDEHGYTPLTHRQFDFALAGIDPDTLNARYLCHHQGERFARTPRSERVVTTGFGMSGLPHLATVSHVLKMIELQKGGEQCQIVLGDLDAYNGRTRPYEEVRDLAARFAIFVERLGFDTDAGVLRQQDGDLAALQALYLLGRYVDHADFEAAEEDNHAFYAARGVIDPTMTFRRSLSLSLMAADFLTLGQDHDAVLVMLGLDEHRYVRFAQEMVSRLDGDSPLRNDFELTAVYTRMVPGFAGNPKFSKSLPGSAIDVTTPAAEVHRLLAGEPSEPSRSATYQLMCQLPRYDAGQLNELEMQCREGGRGWRHAVGELTEYITDLTRGWPR